MIWGIFLTWFADALLFDTMIKTSYEEPINSIDDLIERDMTLSTLQFTIALLIRFVLVLPEHRQWMVEDMKKSDHEKYIILSKKLNFANILLIQLVQARELFHRITSIKDIS